MFVNRRKELGAMSSYLDMIISGQHVNLSLFGQRRTGKTELLKRFRSEAEGVALVPYLNLERMVPRINDLCLHFVSELFRTTSGKENIISSWPSLLVLSQDVGRREQEALLSLINLLEKNEPDVGAILEVLFKLPQMVAEDKDMPVIYILDEFQEMGLVHDRVLHIMRAVTEKQPYVNYWIAGSVFSAFGALFEGDSPFYGQFERMELGNFDRESSYELIDGLLLYELDMDMKKVVHNITDGNPFYITAICRRLQVMGDQGDVVSSDVLRFCILSEVFGRTGTINSHFEYLIDVSLAKFKSTGVYRSILLHLSRKNDHLTGISSYLDKPTGEVSSYMKNLLRTDLVRKDGDLYSLKDGLMASWLSNSLDVTGPDPLGEPGTSERMYNDLLERFAGVSSELGKAKEIELREVLGSKYGLKLKPYSTFDGQIEFDLVGRKNGVHIFEVKWRTRPVDIGAMEKFLSKVKRSEFSSKKFQLYIVSKGGFKKDALLRAKEIGMICLDRNMKEI